MSIPMPTRQLFIDGEWREPILKKRIPIVNPATEDVIGKPLYRTQLYWIHHLPNKNLCFSLLLSSMLRFRLLLTLSITIFAKSSFFFPLIFFEIDPMILYLLDESGDVPAATTEDVDVAVNAARRAFSRNKGKDWANASGAVRAKYLRAIAAKVFT